MTNTSFFLRYYFYISGSITDLSISGCFSFFVFIGFSVSSRYDYISLNLSAFSEAGVYIRSSKDDNSIVSP